MCSCVHAFRTYRFNPIRRRGDIAVGERSPSPVLTISRPNRVESLFFGSCLNSDCFGGQRYRLREGDKDGRERDFELYRNTILV